MTAADSACPACGTALSVNAKFCHECGSPLTARTGAAEYKQVTVLFADVVRSMDIAAAVGAERLREIMTALVHRASTVVRRYGGTVDKFTGDGIMAIFGAPVSLEDHAVRACAAALEIQGEARHLAAEVEAKDALALQLRIGLNSGEVIAGEIGSGAMGYTAVGVHVGMAQRMESAAPPGGVMLSASTARLAENVAVLADPELVTIKGAADPVSARRLVALAAPRERIGPHASTLVGREWELAALTAMLNRSTTGHGCVAAVVGPPGIGKSRIVAETSSVADSQGVQVFWTYCESHTSEVAFHAVTRLLRAVLGTADLDDATARATVRSQLPDADPADLVLLDDLLGIRDPATDLADIAPDARRRRLTALMITAALTRSTPRVYVIEDAHWIDQASESMLADFLAVVPRTRSLVLITYRPEYSGELTRAPAGQVIALAPLDDSQTLVLIEELLGSDPSVAALADQIAERVAGNPFFAEQIIRDLADRGVVTGGPGAYVCVDEHGEVHVPASLHAAIAARIDRLDATAKRTLNAAAVIGSFDAELLTTVGADPNLETLVKAELVDQVKFSPCAEYAFRHPLIRSVAYESQLKSDRAELHRKLAAAIEQTDENASLIAEHLEAAGDLHEAFSWHMRAGTWLRAYRDIAAAWTSWQRARRIADRLPADDPDRAAMRIAPRARLCATAWRAGGDIADTGFDELRTMAAEADDKVSLAIGMAGQIQALTGHERFHEASQLSGELEPLLESIADPSLTVALLWMALTPKMRVGEVTECVRLAQRVIDLADGDFHMGDLIIETPLIWALMTQAVARACLGQPAWKHQMQQAAAICREVQPGGRAVFDLLVYNFGTLHGLLRNDTPLLQDSAETLNRAEQRGDDFALTAARLLRGLILAQSEEPQRSDGFHLLAMARHAILEKRFMMGEVHAIELETAKQRARTGDHDGATEILRALVDHEIATGSLIYRGAAVAALVETLLQRGTQADLQEAQSAIERLAAVPVEPGFVLYDVALLRLRALLAKARGDDGTYRDFVDRYRAMATSLGFEGHIAVAEAM
ncbi:adenylate/guanylate cyclase domain-containing protein [Mycobacterium branderi]|uniref:Cyclase n=1 Tax=Mycobacterium branderi TaxID=43348 RepID=A0A7I7W9A0_9MYCO|nr:adenylate/guanylate cyclase domain-containing protein [Mycobacterium branderi]MCV7231475.1 AAA family ATPase [Mycobacterium branderi]ORA37444.1 cyclase [Mycobacterium branderi]BBZ13537.1 cyclase [Mycobacterium branderi]